jgi:hypothetical protein
MKYFLILLSLLLPGISYGAEAVIDGQSRVNPGVMFVLNYKGSEGDHFKWLTDPAIEALPEEDRPQPLICGTQYGLALINPGTYYFTLIAADEEGISVAVHELVVGTPTPPPEIEPEPEPSQVKEKSKEAASKLNDPVTAKRLVQAIKGVEASGNLTTTKALVRQAVETVFLTRTDEQRGVDWLDWRLAVDEEIKSVNPQDEQAYLSVISAVTQGLEESITNTTKTNSNKAVVKQKARGPPSLVVYTLPNCTPCNLWKQRELPKLSGWEIEFRTATSGSVPRFEVNGTILQGYQTYNQILSSQE